MPVPRAGAEPWRAPPQAESRPAAQRDDATLLRRLASYSTSQADKAEKPPAREAAKPESTDGFADEDGLPDQDHDAVVDVEDKEVTGGDRMRQVEQRVAELRRNPFGGQPAIRHHGGKALSSLPGAVATRPSAPPPQLETMSISEPVVMAERSSRGSYSFGEEADDYRPSYHPPIPTTEVGIGPPRGWQPPSYAADLAASCAESLRSGQGARRVPLFSETWPVAVERRVYPAIAQDAFLVAEIKNPSERVLPGGRAELFVGADPAGTAQLKVVAPGEAFTLPLGLDRAVRPTRNVKLTTTEKGVFSKDEINEYTVVDEVANPYAAPIKVRITDQWPIATGNKLESKLLRSGGAAEERGKNSLEWVLTIPPGGRSQVTFVYTLRRPKGWRLHQ